MKAAVIGCGRMGAFTSPAVIAEAPSFWLPLSHADAIRSHPLLDLAALVDPLPEQLNRAAAAHDVERTFLGHRALLEEFVPDLIGIATRTIGRADVIADCLSAGVHAIHVEKPLCNTMRELEDLAESFDRPDVHVTLGAVRRHFPVYREGLRLANSGDWGALREIRLSFGRAPLFWTHPHGVDLILFAAGRRRPVSVQARFADVEMGSGVSIRNDPVVLSATILFDDGLVGQIGQSVGCDLALACEAGEIEVVNDGHALTVRDFQVAAYPARRSLPVPTSDITTSGTRAAVEQLVNCLQGDATAHEANRKLKQDILMGQRILFAMGQSHLSGGIPISLDAVDADMEILARTGERFA